MKEDITDQPHYDWQMLPEQVLQLAQWWQTQLTDSLAEIGETFDMKDNADSSVVFIKHLLWLAPLANELQQHEKLHVLFPFVHHAMIELQFNLGSHEPCFLLQALSEEMFKAVLIRRLTIPAPVQRQVTNDRYEVLGEGNASVIASLLEKVIEQVESTA